MVWMMKKLMDDTETKMTFLRREIALSRSNSHLHHFLQPEIAIADRRRLMLIKILQQQHHWMNLMPPTLQLVSRRCQVNYWGCYYCRYFQKDTRGYEMPLQMTLQLEPNSLHSLYCCQRDDGDEGELISIYHWNAVRCAVSEQVVVVVGVVAAFHPAPSLAFQGSDPLHPLPLLHRRGTELAAVVAKWASDVGDGDDARSGFAASAPSLATSAAAVVDYYCCEAPALLTPPKTEREREGGVKTTKTKKNTNEDFLQSLGLSMPGQKQLSQM